MAELDEVVPELVLVEFDVPTVLPLVRVEPVELVLDDEVPFVTPTELPVFVPPVVLEPDVFPAIEIVPEEEFELAPLVVDVLPGAPPVPPGSAHIPLSDEQASNAGQTTQALPPSPQLSGSGARQTSLPSQHPPHVEGPHLVPHPH